MLIGIGISPQATQKTTEVEPPFAGELIQPFDGSWAGPTWNIALGVATSDTDDTNLSRALLFPTASGYTYNFSVEILSNADEGILVIQVFGNAGQTIYSGIPTVGVLAFTYVAASPETNIRFRSADSVVIAIQTPSMTLDA